ncbi:outer spore coat protein CotE [Salirhabdus salicampi]|uniref:outer spore coat protein CotE n=1 Tax=Salirhabdus salicampi TaxID=476102 RepID=UPI0020C54C31|nr:outer spore coat protein CotE [Salirhabdus salicampi]MCP8616442.1 outer spore coat protein CotE [Salirhabdus salicampi]
MFDKNSRQIITKAVCGKGKKFTEASHTVTPLHRPTSILGCWVINHKYSAKKRGDFVEVSGSYDINVWYSYSDNTKTEVVSDKVTYTDKIPLLMKDEHCISDELDVIAKVVQQPNCIECEISSNGNRIVCEIEREFVVEVIGETKMYVKLDPHGKDHDDYDYDRLEAELADLNPDVSSSEESSSDH